MRLICVAMLVFLSGCETSLREQLGGIIGGDGHRKPSARAEAINHFLAASVYEREGKFDRATAEMRKAWKLAPDSLTLSTHLITAYLATQDYENAREAAEEALARHDKNANLWVVLGKIYNQLERPDDAVAAFRKAVELDPKNIMGYGALASMEESANDAVAAIDIYRRLAEMMPKVAVIHFQIGLSLARINDVDGARAEFEKTLQLDAGFSRARFMLGVLYFDKGENEAAAAQLRQYLSGARGDQRARENLVGALVRLKLYPEATGELLRIISSKDVEPRHRIEMAYILLRVEQYSEVEQMIPAEGAPVFGSLLRALARKGLGEPYRPVLESLDAIGGDVEQECTAYLNELLYRFGKDDAGEYLLTHLKGFREEVQSKTLDLIYARALMGLERFEEAEGVLRVAQDRVGSDPAVHYNLAVIYEKLKRVPETEKHLKAYLELKPDDPEILNFLGYLYADHNMKLDEAKALLERALELQPNNGFYLDSLGWVYYRQGDADKAIEHIQRAIRAMGSDDAELRDHLGDAYLLKGDTEKAVAEWKRARRLNPKLEGVQEKLDKHQK